MMMNFTTVFRVKCHEYDYFEDLVYETEELAQQGIDDFYEEEGISKEDLDPTELFIVPATYFME